MKGDLSMKIKMQVNQEVTKEKSIKEGFLEFIKYCRVKNLATKTLDYYEECYDKFTDFLPETEFITAINQNTIDDYILYLRENTGYNDISINTQIRGLRAILYYWMNIGYLSNYKIQISKAEKKIKEPYTEAELKLLLKKPDVKKCDFSEYRDWVIVNYLLGTGNRLNTLINLKVGDINIEDDIILLSKTKNKKQQILPISRTLKKILIEYLGYRKAESNDDYLFSNVFGQKLTINCIESSIARYNQRRGVSKTSIHLFRHTFAKNWILAGGDIFRLQKILGHSTLDVVKEYVAIFGSDLQKDFDKFSPLEKMINKSEYIKMR